jgi:flavin reductase (DIM6/NTAB) family NADH-FMN oxidoreductase RutF
MMARIPAAVAVVTTVVEGEAVGLTATSVCSVSADPATLMVAIDHGSRSIRAFRNADRVAVSFLSSGQESLAEQFAIRGSDKFAAAGIEFREALPPRVLGCRALADCRRRMSHDVADHLLLFLEVERAETGGGAPLLWMDRRFAEVSGEAP